MPDMYERTTFSGKITYLGAVKDRSAALAATPTPSAAVSFAGIDGESHGGETRAACVRVATLHPEGTNIRNTRPLSILADEDLKVTAKEMGLKALDPAWIGASIVVKGIPDLSFLPPGSRLQGPDGCTLVVEMVNHPCTLSGKSIEGFAPGFGAKYKPAAVDRRGVTAWVEREGRLEIGQSLDLFIPAQRGWAPGR